MDEVSKFILVLSVLFLTNCMHSSEKTEFHCLIESPEFSLAAELVSGKDEKFIIHKGDKKLENYLALNLPYPSFAKLHLDLEAQYGKLKNRGEAHLTVITPVEFESSLNSKLSIDEINKIAEDAQIQASKLRPICIGRGTSKVNEQNESTYFIVMEADELFDLRRKIQKAFVGKGGQIEQFNPDHYFPHITIGFSLRDLHESDGVIKSKNACLAKLNLRLLLN